MSRRAWALATLGVAAAFAALASCLFVVDVTEYAVVTRLGEVREVVQGDGRGLHVKWPSPVEEVTRLDARVQVLELPSREYLTEDKTNVTVDAYCVWKISDPLAFQKSVSSTLGAENRLTMFIRSQIGSSLGEVPFAHLVNVTAEERRLDEVVGGIAERTRDEARRYGIEVLDVRIQRLNYPAQNQNSVFDRMRAERVRIAKRFRSEGEEQSVKIRAEADRAKAVLLAEARRDAARLRGEGEAEATRIFAEALAEDPEFYRFLRTLQAYRTVLDEDTTLVLPADSELMRLLVYGSLEERPR